LLRISLLTLWRYQRIKPVQRTSSWELQPQFTRVLRSCSRNSICVESGRRRDYDPFLEWMWLFNEWWLFLYSQSDGHVQYSPCLGSKSAESPIQPCDRFRSVLWFVCCIYTWWTARKLQCGEAKLTNSEVCYLHMVDSTEIAVRGSEVMVIVLATGLWGYTRSAKRLRMYGEGSSGRQFISHKTVTAA
jgi:hypothetical protein